MQTGSDLGTPVQAFALSYNNQQTGPQRPNVRRITTTVYPNTNDPVMSSQTNRTLRFGINAEGFLDGCSSYLMFDITNSATIDATHHAMFNPYTDSWLERISIYSNSGTLIEDIQKSDVLAHILKEDISLNYMSSVGNSALNMLSEPNYTKVNAVQPLLPTYCAGASTETDKFALSTGGNMQRYIIEMKCSGFLNAYNFIPCRALANSQSNAFYIEVVFTAPQNMITQTLGVPPASTNGAYTISNCVYMADIVYDDVKEAELNEMLKENPIVFHFCTWKNHTNTIQANTTTNNVTISEFQESIEEIAIIFQNSNFFNNINYASWEFGLPNAPLCGTDTINNFQLKIGNYLYPVQQLNQSTGTAQKDYEYAKSIYKNKCYDKGSMFIRNQASGVGGGLPTSSNIDYIIRYPLRVMPEDANGDTVQYFFGLNTKTNPVSIQLLLNTSNLVSTYNVQSYVRYDVSLVIMKNESFIVS